MTVLNTQLTKIQKGSVRYLHGSVACVSSRKIKIMDKWADYAKAIADSGSALLMRTKQ